MARKLLFRWLMKELATTELNGVVGGQSWCNFDNRSESPAVLSTVTPTGAKTSKIEPGPTIPPRSKVRLPPGKYQLGGTPFRCPAGATWANIDSPQGTWLLGDVPP